MESEDERHARICAALAAAAEKIAAELSAGARPERRKVLQDRLANYAPWRPKSD